MIIYKKSESLITTGDRSVNNFQSGLIRVDQKFMGISANAASDRTLLAEGLILPGQTDDPSMDGLFIYGGAQESSSGDGFTTYQASAYGRRTDSMVELSRAQSTIIETTPEGLIFTNSLSVTVYNMTGAIVKKRGEFIDLSELILTDEFLIPVSVEYLSFGQIETISVTETNFFNRRIPLREYTVKFDTDNESLNDQTFILQDPIITLTAQRNFGEFVEYEFESVRNFGFTTSLPA